MSKLTKEQARRRRHARVRAKVRGTTERPRLAVPRDGAVDDAWVDLAHLLVAHAEAGRDTALVDEGLALGGHLAWSGHGNAQRAADLAERARAAGVFILQPAWAGETRGYRRSAGPRSAW